MSIFIKLLGRRPITAFGEWNSWEDKSICVEVYLHKDIGEPLCLDCQQFWDSWNAFQRGQAMMNGRAEYERHLMEDIR